MDAIFGVTASYMKVNGLTVKNTAKVHGQDYKATNILVNGTKGNRMEKEYINGLMVINMKANLVIP